MPLFLGFVKIHQVSKSKFTQHPWSPFLGKTEGLQRMVWWRLSTNERVLEMDVLLTAAGNTS